MRECFEILFQNSSGLVAVSVFVKDQMGFSGYREIHLKLAYSFETYGNLSVRIHTFVGFSVEFTLGFEFQLNG